jgi:hypothetical protein
MERNIPEKASTIPKGGKSGRKYGKVREKEEKKKKVDKENLSKWDRK